MVCKHRLRGHEGAGGKVEGHADGVEDPRSAGVDSPGPDVGDAEPLRGERLFHEAPDPPLE